MIAKKFVKIKKFLIWFILFTAVIGIVIFLVVANFKMAKRKADVNNKIEEYKTEIANLQEESEKIKSGLFDAGNNNIEREIRERLDFKKPGENVVVVVPPKESGESNTTEQKTFWENVLDSIKENFNF